MKVHYSDDEYAEEGICGCPAEDIIDDWRYVDCKKCLKMKVKYLEACERDNEAIAEDMGRFVDFCNSKEA